MQEMLDHTGSKNVLVYDTGRVCYFLVAQEKHLAAIKATNLGLGNALINKQI